MTLNSFKIREIKPRDNHKIAKVIRNILIEFGVPKVGTAYADKILDTLYEAYNTEKAIYYIIEKDNKSINAHHRIACGILHIAHKEGVILAIGQR